MDLIYILPYIYRSLISEWRQQSKKHWSVTASNLQAWMPATHYVQETLFSFFRALVFLVGPHAITCSASVWNGRLNQLQAFIIYTVFLIKKKKCQKPLVASAASLVEADRAGRGSNTEPGIAKPVAPSHHSHRIMDSSQQSSPDILPKDYFKYSKFSGADNFSYKLIINTVLCCVKQYQCPSGHLTSGG